MRGVTIGATLTVLLVIAFKGGRSYLRYKREQDRRSEDPREKIMRDVDRTIRKATEPLPAFNVSSFERSCLVDAASVGRAAGEDRSVSPQDEDYEKEAGPAGARLLYEYSRYFDVFCHVTRWQSAEDARVHFEEAKQVDTEYAVKPHPFEGGSEAWAADLVEDKPRGNVVVCRSGRHVFFFECTGIHLDRAQLETLLRPYVERFPKWFGR